MLRLLASSVWTFCSLGALPLHAATIVNGSFENLTLSYVNTAGSDSMSNAVADGWTISTNSPDWFLGAPGPSNRWSTPWGDFFAVGAAGELGYREGLSQTITGLTVGSFYRIEFQQANGMLYDQGSYIGAGNTGGWEVLIDGSSVLSSGSLNDNSIPATPFPVAGTDWNLSSVIFQATATSQDLEFLAYTDSPTDPTFQFLDSVIITESQIPEPETALLFAFGGLALLGRRRPL